MTGEDKNELYVSVGNSSRYNKGKMEDDYPVPNEKRSSNLIGFGTCDLRNQSKDVAGATQRADSIWLGREKTFTGYPLHVEYSLTAGRGRYMLEALKIMQKIGTEYMIEHGMK